MAETAPKNQETIRRFAWVINSVGLGGIPVNVVSKKLHVDPSFVTTQSKMLEKKGFLRRKTSTEDARVVLMSLTDKTCKQLAGLAAQQEALNEFIFAELSNKQLDELIDTLSGLRTRLEKGRLKVIADA